jgi:Fe-S-cluster containining protein
MNKSRQLHIPAGISAKKELLGVMYSVYSRWAVRFPLVCKKGCAACCTQSVTMTSLEGAAILDFIKSRGREKWLHEKLARAAPGKSGPEITTNQFAEACLTRREVDEEAFGSWDFAPCIFLEETLCSIYEARPFGCRSFASLVPCTADTAAEVAPIYLAVNTVFSQIIEHTDSDGGTWAAMTDMLLNLAGRQTGSRATHILEARPLPGFLLDPHEIYVVKHLLQQLYNESGRKRTFGDLIDNFMPI